MNDYQPDLPIDPNREALRDRSRQYAKGRRDVQTGRLVDQMLAAGAFTADELKRYARRGLVKEAQDVLNEVNRTTGVPDFEQLPGSEDHAQIDLMTFEEYGGRIIELIDAAKDDLGRIASRLKYCQRRWHRVPRLPAWFRKAMDS